jgi:hypothetical protein
MIPLPLYVEMENFFILFKTRVPISTLNYSFMALYQTNELSVNILTHRYCSEQVLSKTIVIKDKLFMFYIYKNNFIITIGYLRSAYWSKFNNFNQIIVLLAPLKHQTAFVYKIS